MGLMDRQGSDTQGSGQYAEVATSGSTWIPPEDFDTSPAYTNPSDVQQSFEDLPFIKDSSLQRMVTDTTQYADATAQIQGFMSGHRLQGVYFTSLNVHTGERTNIVDDPQIRSVIHSRYDRIENYEVTLLKEWDYQENPETASSHLSFVAYTYPGFNPKVGDIFLTAVGDGKIGYFKVTTLTATSWRDARAYEVNFTMTKFLDQEAYDFLMAATRQTLYATKTGVNGVTTTMLTSQDASNLSYLQDQRNIFMRKYYNLFYDDRVSTFIRPDGYYDPYVVRFVNTLGNVDITGERAVQLLYEVDQTYDRTFWSRMEVGAMNDLDDVYPRFIASIRNNRINDTFITPLSGHGFVSMAYDETGFGWAGEATPPEQVRYPYVFEEAFYRGITTSMTPLENIVYKAIYTRSIDDVNGLINNYLKTWGKEKKINRFYITPIYVWLMDIAIASIQGSSS